MDDFTYTDAFGYRLRIQKDPFGEGHLATISAPSDDEGYSKALDAALPFREADALVAYLTRPTR